MTEFPTCGVALCACNGEKYVLEQLRSIERQSRAPDHVVVSDDASSDDTWEILNDWKDSLDGRLRVTLVRNEKRLGLTQNLSNAIDLLDTDIIFTSDQDDVWAVSKVEEISRIFERKSDALLVFTNAVLGDVEGRPLAASLFQELEVTARERRLIEKNRAPSFLIRRNVVTGATAAFRKSLWTSARPIPRNWMHDAWLAIIAASMEGLLLHDSKTIMYRQHGSNLIGVRKVGKVEKMKSIAWRMKGIDSLKHSIRGESLQRAELASRLKALPGINERALLVAERAHAFSVARQDLVVDGRLKCLAGVCGHFVRGDYFKFSRDWGSDFLRDLLRR